MKRLGTLWLFLALGLVPVGTSSAETATAALAGTSEDSPLAGAVMLTDTPEGLQISAKVANVPPGTHGFHIHQFGSCEDGGKSAGGHFNPDGVKHGALLTDGFSGAHAGDLANFEVTESGGGSFSGVYPGLSVSQDQYAVAGRAFILHADPDDFGQPTGNAGSRIGCGTIVITGP